MRRVTLAAIAVAVSAQVVGTAFAGDTAGVSKDSIKIGIMGPMSGSAALFGKAVFGVEALFRDVNDNGGIHSRRIELIREDTACEPAKGLAAFKKLVSQEMVFAINGGMCSGVVMALKPEIAKTNVPFMDLGAASGAISNPMVANLFQPVATTDEVARVMIDFIMTRPNTKKIAFVGPSDDWGKSNLEPAIRHLRDKYKIEPALILTMEKGSSDATPHILQIRNGGIDAVVAMMYPAEIAIFLRDTYKYGLKVPVLAPQSVSIEDTRDRVGGPAAVQNLYVFYPFASSFDSPTMKKWAELIKKYYPNERIENFSFLGMGGALAIIEALKKAGPDLSRDSFIEALNNIRDFDTGVLSAPISFSPTDHAGVKGGAMVTLNGNQVVVLKAWQEK